MRGYISNGLCRAEGIVQLSTCTHKHARKCLRVQMQITGKDSEVLRLRWCAERGGVAVRGSLNGF